MFFVSPVNSQYVSDSGFEFGGGGDEFSGIGSFFKKIVKSVVPVAAGFIPGVGGFVSAGLSSAMGGGGGGGNKAGIAKGLAAINQFGAGVIDSLNQLKSQVRDSPAETVSQAETIAGYLNDSSRVFQPKKGKDAAALATFKTQAAALVAEIKQLAAQVPAQTSTTSPNTAMTDQGNGQIIQLPNGQTAQVATLPNGQQVLMPVAIENNGGGLDTSTIVIGGGIAIALILVLTRR